MIGPQIYELDSAYCRGELAERWRSPMSVPAHWKGDAMRVENTVQLGDFVFLEDFVLQTDCITVSPDANFRPQFWDGKGWLEAERSEDSKTLSREIRICQVSKSTHITVQQVDRNQSIWAKMSLRASLERNIVVSANSADSVGEDQIRKSECS